VIMSDVEGANRADEIGNLLVRVYEIHEFVIVETGGLPGLRDAAMLHSAVARPFVTFDGNDLYASDFAKAGALFHSLIKNHPFMDGTKRTAFAARSTFSRPADIQYRIDLTATPSLIFALLSPKRICVCLEVKVLLLATLTTSRFGFSG
jgi:prophage maintenance system killer protein